MNKIKATITLLIATDIATDIAAAAAKIIECHRVRPEWATDILVSLHGTNPDAADILWGELLAA